MAVANTSDALKAASLCGLFMMLPREVRGFMLLPGTKSGSSSRRSSFQVGCQDAHVPRQAGDQQELAGRASPGHRWWGDSIGGEGAGGQVTGGDTRT
ncbi:hypothetical protein [Streptomyces sp. NBC_01643]|uniref:hypothetical protein n=1 Tax=Streptomyces sp. NBC_01643 TaxID=2975906 RepID=UPI003867379B|nr:hypothetical protein OHB03_07135 [Streptomyces sp. NBC_01643]